MTPAVGISAASLGRCLSRPLASAANACKRSRSNGASATLLLSFPQPYATATHPRPSREVAHQRPPPLSQLQRKKQQQQQHQGSLRQPQAVWMHSCGHLASAAAPDSRKKGSARTLLSPSAPSSSPLSSVVANRAPSSVRTCATAKQLSSGKVLFGSARGLGMASAAAAGDGGVSATTVGGMDPIQHKLMFEDECILVDENDRVVGHDNKYNCHLMEKIDKEGLLHRAFSVFLFNSNNELLLQQRASAKVTFPLVWTNTCCSHPLYRESEMVETDNLGVKEAARRKLLDELGIPPEEMPVDSLTCLGRIHYKAPSNDQWGEHEIDYLLVAKRNVSTTPNPNEVAAVRYVDRAALRELVRKADVGEDGVKLSPWFRLVVDRFLFGWWDRVENGTLEQAVDMATIHRLV